MLTCNLSWYTSEPTIVKLGGTYSSSLVFLFSKCTSSQLSGAVDRIDENIEIVSATDCVNKISNQYYLISWEIAALETLFDLCKSVKG